MLNFFRSCFLKLLLVGIMACFISSCYTRVEGCLDPLAENYSVLSDDNCDKCCVYPKLTLEFSHQVGDSLFSTSDTLVNDFGQKYRILDVKYYVSNFKLYKQDKSIIKILEYIEDASKTLIIPDDIKIARYSVQTLDIGSIKDFGSYDSLSFTLGLSDEILQNNFDVLPENHSLLSANRIKSPSDKLAHFMVKIEKFVPDTIIETFHLTQSGISKHFTIDSTIMTRPGYKPAFSVKADYSTLFKNINLTSDSISKINILSENFHKFLIVK